MQLNSMFVTYFKTLILALLVSACSQSEPSADSNSGKQSATAVKSQTQHLQLKSLGSNVFTGTSNDSDAPNLRSAQTLYLAKLSDVQVEDNGKVIKILANDNDGSRHQKFIVQIASGQTLLFAHNIDLAPRIDDIAVGDTISFRGEYEYNPKGGIVHWTHHDPQGSNFGGWIKHNGNIYQ